MRKQDVLGLLRSHREELQSMTKEEFTKRKIDQGLQDKIYNTVLYSHESIEPYFVDEAPKFELTKSFESHHTEKISINTQTVENCFEGIKMADIQNKMTPVAA